MHYAFAEFRGGRRFGPPLNTPITYMVKTLKNTKQLVHQEECLLQSTVIVITLRWEQKHCLVRHCIASMDSTSRWLHDETTCWIFPVKYHVRGKSDVLYRWITCRQCPSQRRRHPNHHQQQWVPSHTSSSPSSSSSSSTLPVIYCKTLNFRVHLIFVNFANRVNSRN